MASFVLESAGILVSVLVGEKHGKGACWVKLAANRGLTKAGPAIVCSRKRREQVLEMLEDEQQLAFLVGNWRSRRIWSSLLEHVLSHQEVRRLDPAQKLSRLYGYSEEDHFKDCEDSARAEAVYRQALRDQTSAGQRKLPSASYQVVNWLKGHLATGVFFSISTPVFEQIVDGRERMTWSQLHPSEQTCCCLLCAQTITLWYAIKVPFSARFWIPGQKQERIFELLALLHTSTTRG